MVVAWRMATREWWDHYSASFELYTSKYVLAELGFAPPAKARRARAMLRHVQLLEEPAGFFDVVACYVEHHLMPAGAQGDAAHLALASMCRMDYLLTWNCRHLANANKMRHLAVINGRLGLSVPLVTTPLYLLPEGIS
jgi:hypothetical protein